MPMDMQQLALQGLYDFGASVSSRMIMSNLVIPNLPESMAVYAGDIGFVTINTMGRVIKMAVKQV